LWLKSSRVATRWNHTSAVTKSFRNVLVFAVGLALVALWCQAAGQSANPASSVRKPAVWGDFVETNFPFFSSALDARKLGTGFPTNNLTPRGIVLNLGNDCWACFDIDLLRMSAVWTGNGVTPVSMSQISYHSPETKAIEGQEHLPQIVGTPWLANGMYPG